MPSGNSNVGNVIFKVPLARLKSRILFKYCKLCHATDFLSGLSNLCLFLVSYMYIVVSNKTSCNITIASINVQCRRAWNRNVNMLRSIT